MPYVDQGEQEPRPMNLSFLPWVAVIVATIVPGVFWYATFKAMGLSLLGALAGGVVIGLAAKFTLQRPDPAVRIAAIVVTVLGCLAGYIWVDSTIWTPFMLGQSVSRFFGDMTALIVTGFSAYLAFVLATPRQSGHDVPAND